MKMFNVLFFILVEIIIKNKYKRKRLNMFFVSLEYIIVGCFKIVLIDFWCNFVYKNLDLIF